ncbi:MAG: M56 family metallopeptidase [Pseudomonadota bacterium]
MTGMKPALDLVVDANVVFLLAFFMWWTTQAIVRRTRLRTDYATQLRMLRTVLLFVILSPLLSFAAVTACQVFWPKAPITASDLAVAAYLRGDIAVSAVRFEELLNTRNDLFKMVLTGQLPWLTGLLVILMFGSLALFVQTILVIGKISRLIDNSFVWRRTRTTDIRLSDTATIPFAARGVFRRHVVIPSALLAHPRKMKIVLAHEFEHLRQGDVEWEVAFEFLRPLLYWNPVYLLWKRSFDQLRELSCDQAVISAMRLSPGEYARFLLSFCKGQTSRTAVPVFNVAFVRGGTSSAARRALESRFLALAEPRRRTASRLTYAMVAAVFAFSITLSAASVRNPGDWSQDRLMLSTIVNLERLQARGY